jgi:uncharacterized protein (DUF1499 family)
MLCSLARPPLVISQPMRQREGMDTDTASRPLSRIALGGFVLALVAGLMLIFAGAGYRLGWWDFRPGLTIFRWAAYGGAAAVVLSLLGTFFTRSGSTRRGFPLAVIGLVVGLVVTWIPWQWWQVVKRVPMIHDITTDTETPPVFVAILPLRAGAPNTAEYGGPEIAAQQRTGYPDLKPLTLAIPPAQAFPHALAVAREMGWEIAANEPTEGRIEATDTTFWFGFKDDVVVRITPAGSGSRIDVRSVSRVGKSDVGKNAERITEYLQRIARVASSLSQANGNRSGTIHSAHETLVADDAVLQQAVQVSWAKRFTT